MALPPLSNFKQPKVSPNEAPAKTVRPDHVDGLMQALTDRDPKQLRSCLESLVAECFDAPTTGKE